MDTVIGITKAYITRVGNGHMPTELFDEVGEHLTSVGHEFGTTTGRRRRCGWFDAVVMRHSNRVNGFTEIALTKLDVLGGLDEIKICVGYKMGDVEINEMPASAIALEDCEPVYVTMPGFASHSLEEWLGISRKCNSEGLGFSGLPAACPKLHPKIGIDIGSNHLIGRSWSRPRRNGRPRVNPQKGEAYPHGTRGA